MGSRQWFADLAQLCECDSFPLLRDWWQAHLVARVMVSADPMAEAIEAAADYRGGCALLLAIENETTIFEASHHGNRSTRSTRGDAAGTAQANGAA